MPETRSAAKRRRIAQVPIIPPLHFLPLSVAGEILGYLDLASLVCIGACNGQLKKQVYEYHHWLWSTIDFGPVGRSVASRISDCQLEALLRKSHALQRCRTLKLNGCTHITGNGLEPLRGSCMLREIDLRLAFEGESEYPDAKETKWPCGPVELNLDFVLPLLSSMPPITPTPLLQDGSLGLSLVKIRKQRDDCHDFYQYFDHQLSMWYTTFFGALETQADVQQTRCGHCDCVIAHVTPKDDLLWAMSLSYCEKCKKYTCSAFKDGCLDKVDCNRCMVQCCQPHNESEDNKCPNYMTMHVCISCGFSECDNCYDGMLCHGCDRYYCQIRDCCNSNCSVCETCEIAYCRECLESNPYVCSHLSGAEQND